MDGEISKKVSNQVVKVTQALGVLLSFDDNHKMDRVKLIKLLWAADRFHVRKYGRTVSEMDDYVAMIHGPVSSLALDIAAIKTDFELSDEAVAYVEHFFTTDARQTGMTLSPGDDHLSETDKGALQWAWEMFGTVETFDLADTISHRYPEWRQYEQFFNANGAGRRPIDTEDFFRNPESSEKDYFATDEATLEAARLAVQEAGNATAELKRSLGL